MHRQTNFFTDGARVRESSTIINIIVKSLSLSFSVPVNPDEHALSCQINGLLFRDGASAEVLKESADKSSIYCQQCQCQSGKHTCHKIYDCDIQKVACEKSVKIPGQCCPSCGEYSVIVGG